jgi:hypothetical protein
LQLANQIAKVCQIMTFPNKNIQKSQIANQTAEVSSLVQETGLRQESDWFYLFLGSTFWIPAGGSLAKTPATETNTFFCGGHDSPGVKGSK